MQAGVRDLTFVTSEQELILEKVRDDMLVRTEISQSSSLRERRGHTAAAQWPDGAQTAAPVGLNNNGPFAQKHGPPQANGTTKTPEQPFSTTEELKVTRSDRTKEAEPLGVSSDSASEISKFESEFVSRLSVCTSV